MRRLVLVVLATVIVGVMLVGPCWGDITVKYDKFKDATVVSSTYRGEARSQPALSLLGIYKGQDKGNLVAVGFSFISVSDSWRFLKIDTVRMLIDGERYEYKVSQSGSIGRGYVIESIRSTTPQGLEIIKKLSQAKKVEVQIMGVEFTLRDSEMEDLKKFVAHFEEIKN